MADCHESTAEMGARTAGTVMLQHLKERGMLAELGLVLMPATGCTMHRALIVSKLCVQTLALTNEHA